MMMRASFSELLERFEKRTKSVRENERALRFATRVSSERWCRKDEEEEGKGRGRRERGIGSIERAKKLSEKVFFTREQSCGGRNISTRVQTGS